MADETGLNVGTITALYKIDRTQSVTQVGEIKQEAAEIRNIYGNITMKLDSSQVIAETRQMIQAGTEAKLAYAGAQQSLAAYRDAQVKVAEATATARQWQALANETVAGTRVVQQQAAVQTAINTNAINAQRLATEQQRTLSQQTIVQLQQERVATQQLATTKQQLAVDTAELRKAMLEKNIALQDQTKQSNTASTAHGQLSQSLIGGIIRGLEYAVAFRALYGAMGLVTQGFHDLTDGAIGWEQTLNELQNNTTLVDSQMGVLATTILQMGQTTSAPLNELATGYRHATNEGFDLARSTEIVNEAQKSAVSTGANVAATTNILASVMHEFSAQNLGAAQTMNVLHLAAAEGNLTLEQLVTSGGRAFATAASLGLSLTEVSAALSTLTREGYSASQSTTIVSDIMLHIVNPSKQARDEILALSKATGIDLVYDFSQAGLASKGLSGVMADVEKATNGDAKAMFALIPGLRGGRGELVLTTQGASDFRTILNDLNDTMAGKTNPTQDAYNRTVETAAFQIGKFKNEMHELWIELGQYFLPIIKVVVSELGLLIQEIAQSLGAPIPDFSGALDKTTQSANNTTAAVRSTEAAVHNGTEGFTAHSQSIIDASRSMDDYKQQSLDAGAAIRGLTETQNGLKAALDRTKESIASINDSYKQRIDPLRAQIATENVLSPEEQARKIAELQLDAQAIQVKLAAPDTSLMDQSILDLRQKIDDLGKADTAAVDERINTLQDKMQTLGRSATRELDQQILDLRSALAGIGDTTDIDRKIEDLKRSIAAPAPDVTSQTSGQAALFEQQASGQITQAQFQQQYGALARQKGQILDNYAAQQSAAKTQLQVLEEQEIVQKRTDEDAKKSLNDRISTLERQKAQISQDNAVQKDALQLQLDAAQDERKVIISTFDAKKEGYERDLKQAQLDRANAVLSTNEQLAKIAKEQEHNKLLDDAAKIQRDLFNMPRQAQIDALTAAQKAEIDPLTAQRDLQQAALDLNNEDIARWRVKKGEIDAANTALKDYLKQPPIPTGAGEGPGARTGPQLGGFVGGGSLIPLGGEGDIDVAQNPMVKWAADIKTALETLHTWFTNHKGEIGQDVRDMIQNVSNALDNAGTAFSMFGSIAEFMFYFAKGMSDIATFNFDQAGEDFQHMGDGLAGAINAGMNFNKGGGGGGGGGAKIPSAEDVLKNPVLGGTQANIGQVPNMLTTNPMEPGGFLWLLLHPGQSGAQSPAQQVGPTGPTLGPPLPPDWGDQQAAQAQTAISANNDYAQNTATVFGPSNPTTMAISNYIDNFIKGFGQDGTVGQAIDTTKTKTTQDLGSGSTTQETFRNLDQQVSRIFGGSGTIKQYMGTDTPTSLGQLKASVDQYFGQGVGTAVTPLSAYEAFMRGIFGAAGGSINTLMTTDVPASYRGYLQEVLDRFGDTGDAKTPFTTYGDFIKVLFQKGGSLDSYVQAFGPVVDAAMPSDIAPLAAFIKSVGDAIRQIGTIFKIPEMMNFADVPITYAGSGNKNYAMGVSNSPMPGHVAWVGERGPELMHVPQGSTIIPTHMLPGHADGLNLAAIQKFTLPGAFQPLADFLYSTEQSSMSALIAAHQGAASGRGRASLRQLVPLIQKWADADGLPADIIGAIILHESGGNIGQVEIGGGKGRGLMQVDGGTWPQAYDPRMIGTSLSDADYQIEIGSMILQRGWDPNNIVQSLRNYSGAGFDAVHGKSFYQELIDMGFIAQADAALTGGTAALAGLSGGGWIEVVNAAADRVGQFFQDNGLQWFLWCEKFVNDMDQAAGFSPRRHGTAYLHAIDTDLDSNTQPPSGASVFFDQSWGEAGHTAIATGAGDETISTTSHGVDYWNIIGSPGYMGWSPPGAANGAVVRSPTIMTVGDVRGGVPEIIAPQPMMKETVAAALKESGMGGPVTLVVEDGAVRVDSAGNVQSVDQSKFKIVNAMYANSMMPGR